MNSRNALTVVLTTPLTAGWARGLGTNRYAFRTHRGLITREGYLGQRFTLWSHKRRACNFTSSSYGYAMMLEGRQKKVHLSAFAMMRAPAARLRARISSGRPRRFGAAPNRSRQTALKTRIWYKQRRSTAVNTPSNAIGHNVVYRPALRVLPTPLGIKPFDMVHWCVSSWVDQPPTSSANRDIKSANAAGCRPVASPASRRRG